MCKFDRMVLAISIVMSAVASRAFAADPVEQTAIPNFSMADFGWLKVSTSFLPPASGPGPVTFDKAHPIIVRMAAARGEVVTAPLRVADLTNPLLKPWVVERMQKENEEVIAGKIRYSARANCRPGGVPEFLTYGGLLEPLYFAQTPKEIVIINQADMQVRHVYMNVPHSMQPKLSWYGESVGHYEGDELVVDTIALTDKSVLDNYGTPHTTQLHVIERFKVIEDCKTLQASFTVEDPGAFNAPWSGIMLYHRSASVMPLTEEPCAENNLAQPGQSFDTPVAVTPDF